jgi:hypothetical protein
LAAQNKKKIEAVRAEKNKEPEEDPELVAA